MEITLGSGKVMIGSVQRKTDGAIGLFFKPTIEEHVINSKDPEWKEGDEYTISESDVVVWIGCLESARVLQDRINMIALEMNGFAVFDSSAIK